MKPDCTASSSSPSSAPAETEFARLIRLIRSQPDVERLHRLHRLPSGRYRYLIETPFQTFPRYVVGTTDRDNNTIHIEAKCGQPANAQRLFDTLPTLN